jgi:hypothetical protein
VPSIGESGFNAEVVGAVVQASITVGTSQIEAKVGGSRQDGRQMLRVYNGSNSIIYFGPTGVTTSTGEPIEKKQWVNIPASDACAVFLIAGSAGNTGVIVSEWA